MKLADLGYNASLEKQKIEQNLEAFAVGRVILEHKDRYMVCTGEKELESELIGNLRFTATDRLDFPAVGDWVAISEYDENKALIHAVFPRTSILKRKAVGKQGQVQVIACNIDYGIIVQAADRDFNLNRLERYLILCNASGVAPIVVLSKTDLIEAAELEKHLSSIFERIPNVPVLCVNNQTDDGYLPVVTRIEKGKTYCLLGSSGVGKSTLLNALTGMERMKTGEISTSVNKGKHITSHRELVVLERGGIIIDNPGMREVGIADAASGLERTFGQISELSENCRFYDCTHHHEKGCAVLEAVEKGVLDKSVYQHFLKLEREKEHFEASVEEKRKKDKDFGKMVRHVKEVKKRMKY